MEVLNRAISKTETTKQENKEQQARTPKGNERSTKESEKAASEVDLLGDDTHTVKAVKKKAPL